MGEAFMRRRLGGEVEWKKYNAVKKTEGYYVDTDDEVGDDEQVGSYISLMAGTGYSWSDDDGWYLTGECSVNGENAVGYYVARRNAIIEITSRDENGVLHGVIVANCDFVTTKTYYAKGTKSYGSVTAKKGVYPGTGSVVDGSPASGWCVMLEGSTYYYYEMVQ